VDEQLEAVGARVAHWRRTRKKRTAMPAALWGAAVALAEEHGINPVAQVLRVDYQGLKVRALEAEMARRNRVETEPGFVELRPAALPEVCEPTGAEVELWRADGSRMTLRMARGQVVDVQGLSEAFWRAGR